MTTTRIAYSHHLNAGRYGALNEQARRLGRVRSEVWQRYGSISGVGLTDRQVRARWLADGTHHQFGVLANAWKETVRDAMADIAAARESAKAHVRRAIRSRTGDQAELKKLFGLLKADRWVDNPHLSRQMRSVWRRGHNRTHNQIVVRADQQHTWAGKDGRLWLTVAGLVRRQMIRIPLNTTFPPTGTLRLILRGGRVEIHYQIDATSMRTSQRPCGVATLGVDKGYTEVLVDSDGNQYGGRIGELLTVESDRIKERNRRRAKLRVSERRGSALLHVNAAYTSQVCHRCGCFGRRAGDRLHCNLCGVVWQADVNAAINVLRRNGDPDITLCTPHRVVRQIVQARADRHRSRLPLPDSSPARRAESESSNLLSNEQ